MEWLNGVVGVLVGLGIAEQVFGLSRAGKNMDEEEIAYDRELFDSKVSVLDRSTLLRLLAKQMEDSDESSDVDQDAYFDDQFFGVIGFSNVDRETLIAEYADRVGGNERDPDFEEMITNLDLDLEYLEDVPTAFEKYVLAGTEKSSPDRLLLQEFVALAEHLANESIFFPAEFAKLAVRVRNHVNG